MNHGEIVSFIWGVADLIRDTFKRGKYQDVILPLTVLRRLDCVLAPTKEKVLKRQGELRGKVPRQRKLSTSANPSLKVRPLPALSHPLIEVARR
jgi:type I restriction-modification system DNA methylase subunit